MKWVKPSGQEIETNDNPATVKHCESLGWKPVKASVKASVKSVKSVKTAKKAVKKAK